MGTHVAISDILKLDLPGSEYRYYPEDANNIIKSQFTRLWGLTSYGRSRTLVNTIESQSLYFPQVCAFEYILNEIQFEIRRAHPKFNLQKEEDIMKRWTQQVIDDSDDDTGIDFYVLVKKMRVERS